MSTRAHDLNRRTFLASAAAIPLAGPLAAAAPTRAGRSAARPVAISSGNGLRTVAKAVEMINAGRDCVDGVVEGVAIVENDPEDMSVGYGGLPNEEGVVELDSSVMHGPMHRAGAVAGIRNIKNPAAVAREVLRRTDHVMLVGEGAYKFARALGFPHEDLLTEQARQAWLRWKANLNRDDDWLDRDQIIRFRGGEDAERVGKIVDAPAADSDIPFTYGTIHCSAVDANGDLGACTTTSGLSYKLPGRVGDSPIIGAGMFVDNEVGSAGATGRGESVIQSCGSFQIVRHMAEGVEPAEACLRALKWIADHTKRPDLLNDRREPNFQVTFYALRKDGAYGSAAMRPGAVYTVCEADGQARTEKCAALFG